MSVNSHNPENSRVVSTKSKSRFGSLFLQIEAHAGVDGGLERLGKSGSGDYHDN